MAEKIMEKRTLFNICLQATGKTAGEFAEEAGVSESFLHFFLSGQRKSARLEALVKQFIAHHLPHLRHMLDEAEATFSRAA